MNKIVNKFLLAGERFMPDMHLRQPGFTHIPCGPFTKNKDRIKKFKETGDSRYIYQNELDEACFQRDMAYGDFKDLTRRTDSKKLIRDQAFNIATNPRKKTSGSGIKNENISNKELAEELHKPIIRKFKRRKVYSYFIDNGWGADLADMDLISKFDKEIRFSICD